MSVTVYTPKGEPRAGDPHLTSAMTEMADELGGYVTDDKTGEMLYDARLESSSE